MLLAVSGFLCMMGFFVPFMFLKRRDEQVMGTELAGLLVSSIGVANTIARILCGYLSSLESVDANLLSNVAITLGGVATFASGYWINSFTQFGYTVVFGFAIGEFIYIQKICTFLIEIFFVSFLEIVACFSALRSIIAVDLMGIEKLTNAFGILMLFQGIAATIGNPIAGALYEATKSYDSAFYFAGTLITLSAILCYPIRIVNRWEKQRALETSKVSPTV